MPSILRRYALREIVPPTLLALSALVFIILVSGKTPWNRDERLLYTLIKLLARPDTPRGEVSRVFFLALPTILMIVAPMALLVGIIIGVGRMTLDREVRAMQTGGLNLLSIFLPIVFLGAVCSAGFAWLAYAPEPRMVAASLRHGGRLLALEFSHLEPGRVYEKIFKGRSGLSLYFDGQDSVEGGMKGVALLMERRELKAKESRSESWQDIEKRIADLKRLEEAGEISHEQYDRMAYEAELRAVSDPPVMIFAENARFDVDPEEGRVQLELRKGSVHLLDADKQEKEGEQEKKSEKDEMKGEGEKEVEARAATPLPKEAGREYAILRYDRLVTAESLAGAGLSRNRRMMTTPDLRKIARDGEAKAKDRNDARATVLERYSQSLQCLIYAFIGLPLAIWIRPTGKSVGIILAGGVILIYNLMLRTGFSMVSADRALGPLMMFSPSILFAALGMFLWRRAIRQ